MYTLSQKVDFFKFCQILNQHFGGYAIQPNSDDEEQFNEIEVVPGFVLASDYHMSTEEPPKIEFPCEESTTKTSTPASINFLTLS